jgi:probable DNA repair protein
MHTKPLITITDELLDACRDSLVLTPNRRLKDALKFAYDLHHVTQAQRTWPTARIQTFDEHLETAYRQLAADDPLARPRLLSSDAQRLAWLQATPEDSEVDADSVYPLVESAWQTAHAWHLADRLSFQGGAAALSESDFDETDDGRLFNRWARAYKSHARRRWLTKAELPRVIADAVVEGQSTSFDALLAFGFDAPTPAQERLLNAYRGAGVKVTRRHPAGPPTNPVVCACPTPQHELRTAIRWARRLLEASQQNLTVGIAVPNLVDRYDEVVRMLAAELCPDQPFADSSSEPFNVSGGTPLRKIRLVADAIDLLRWLGQPLHHATAGRLINSPFFTWEAKALPSYLPTSFTLAELCASNRFEESFARVQQRLSVPVSRALPMSAWVQQFTAVLSAAGWPNSERLSSESYQAFEAFQSLLETLPGALATLGDSASTIRGDDALALVEVAAGQRLFAPKRSHAPIQVLGYIEAVGLQFDHLWVMGLTETSWPGTPRPNPMIPSRMQIEAGVPRSAQSLEWAFAERLTQIWLGTATDVVCSYPQAIGEERQLPSPLLADYPVRAAGLLAGENRKRATPSHGHPYTLRRLKRLDTVFDEAGPPLDATPTYRGTGVLRDQASCPFKAFTRYRLDAKEADLPHSYPDLRERGNAVHEALEKAYQLIDSRDALATLGQEARSALAGECARAAVERVYYRGRRRLAQGYVEQEIDRIGDLVQQWFAVDLERAPFLIRHREHELDTSFAGFPFKVRIDRVDAWPDHPGELLIDYKTGRPSMTDWQGARPREPQLPLYALLTSAAGIAFAAVRDGESSLLGISEREEDSGGGVKLEPADRLGVTNFAELLATWRPHLEHLVKEFQSGQAAVAPRSDRDCDLCHLHAVCRVNELKDNG